MGGYLIATKAYSDLCGVTGGWIGREGNWSRETFWTF